MTKQNKKMNKETVKVFNELFDKMNTLYDSVIGKNKSPIAKVFSEKEKNTLYNFGTQKMIINDYKSAAQIFELLNITEPSNTLYIKALAGSLQAQEQFDSAIILYNLALVNKADNYDCIYYIAICYLKLKKFHDAKEYFELFIQKEKNNSELIKKSKLYLKSISKDNHE